MLSETIWITVEREGHSTFLLVINYKHWSFQLVTFPSHAQLSKMARRQVLSSPYSTKGLWSWLRNLGEHREGGGRNSHRGGVCATDIRLQIVFLPKCSMYPRLSVNVDLLSILINACWNEQATSGGYIPSYIYTYWSIPFPLFFDLEITFKYLLTVVNLLLSVETTQHFFMPGVTSKMRHV